MRIAFPRYRERPLLYDKAIVSTSSGGQHVLEILEDVNAISFQVLRQRMVLELSKSLLRVALKKVAEYQISKQNQVLGTIVGGINFLTEKADTRNWQTIPHSIYYTRMRLPEGMHQVSFKAFSGQRLDADQQHLEFSLQLYNNQTVFQIVHSPVVATSYATPRE